MPKPSGISTKAIGLLAAALLTLVFIVIIAISMSSTPPPTNKNADLFPSDSSEIPNVEDTQKGGKMFVTMVDKDDPTRVAATLKADRFEPIGEGRRRLDNPESWIYLQDGRVIKITADFATMLMPDPNEPPESGTLEGNIKIQAFESTDITQPPTLTALFDEPVEFERRYLRLRSPGHFTISSAQFDFAGTDLTVILNELRDRVELVDVAHGDHIIIHTDVASSKPSSAKPTHKPAQHTTDATAPNTQSTTKDLDPTTTPTAPPPTVTELFNRYHIVLAENVIAAVNQAGGSGQATADRLELWASLQGGSLPTDAIKPIAFALNNKNAKSDAPTEPQSTPNPAPTTSQSASQSASKPTTTPSTNNDIVITWSGRMSIRPIDGDLPPQLIDNDLTIELVANKDSGVTFSVPDQGFVGQAFSASYHATQGLVSLSSKQTSAGYIKLEAAQAGSLVATMLAANLSTGEITLDKRGQITSTPKGPDDLDSQSTIQWKKNASFTLAMDTTGPTDRLTDRLTHAHFAGTVIARQGGNSVGALTLDADFDPTLDASQSLTKLTMTQGVLSSASRSMLTGGVVEIEFVPDDDGNGSNNTVQPTTLIADGQVFGRTVDSMLKTEHLEATMYRNLAGDIAIRTADAKGNIQYTGIDRTTAQGNTLAIDGVNETMLLLGSPAKVAQGGSSIVGDHIKINARSRGIEVLGPGSFDHDIVLESDTSPARATGHIRATWKGSMRFDDALGSIICEKQVRVVSTPDAYTRDTIDAHRAEIKLTPMPTADPIAGTNRPTPRANNDRELLTARIFGHAPAGLDPVPAKIESRTYDQDDPERVIGLIYLEGPQILVNNQAQTLDVPAAGTLLIMDRSEDADAENDATTDSKASPGLTRFAWEGSMNLDRAQGTARFTDQVVVRQKTISTGKLVSLSTDQLDARFEIGQQGRDSTTEQSTRLLGVDATGSVRFLYEGKELLADSAIYDAITDSLFASALGNKLVTLYDDTQPAPMSSKTMKWDLANDQFEINAPTPARIGG